MDVSCFVDQNKYDNISNLHHKIIDVQAEIRDLNVEGEDERNESEIIWTIKQL